MACSTATLQGAIIPCSKLHEGTFEPMSSCQSPFMEGIVDGRWIGLVLHYTGGNNRIDKAMVFSVGTGEGRQ